MKRLFTLVLTVFILFSIQLKAQNTITVYRALNETSYSNDNIASTTINVLAGEIIHLKIKIAETNTTDFAINTYPEKLNLFIPENLTFTGVAGTNYTTYSNSVESNVNITFTKTSNPGNVTDSPNEYLYNDIKVNNTTTTDSIVIKKVKIQIPTDIGAGTYTLSLEDSLNGGPTETTLLTFNYETPVMNVTATTPVCISEQVTCNVSVASPDDLTYILYVNETKANGINVGTTAGDVEITNSTRTLKFNYGDEVSIRDHLYLTAATQPPAGGISEPALIKGDTLFHGIQLNINTTSNVCQGDNINFSITKEGIGCTLDNFTYRIFFDEDINFNNITDNDTITTPNNFDYSPPTKGYVRVRATGPGANPIVIYSDPEYISNIFELPENYSLYSRVRISLNDGEINLFNKFEDNKHFNYNGFGTLDIPGIYDGAYTDMEYFTNSVDSTFGRFQVNYDKDKVSADSLFDPEAENVITGDGNINEVWFHYGKCFVVNTDSIFCYDSTKSDITVIKSQIFIPQTSYCSYDSISDTIQISATLDDLEFVIEDTTYSSKSTFYGYAIKNTFGRIIQEGSEQDPVFIPDTLWRNRDNSSVAMPVEVTAIANVEITKLAEDCPAPWTSTHGNPEIYQNGDRVSYMNSQYECIGGATADDIPGQGLPWSSLGLCHRIWVETGGGGGIIQEIVSVESSEIKSKEIYEKDPVLPIEDGYWEYHCIYDSWNSIGNPSPIYFVGDRISYLGNDIYKCNTNAYYYDRPEESSKWTPDGTCGEPGDPLQIHYNYATTTFYIYAPQDDGRLLNLSSQYGLTNQAIELSCNYTIDTITGHLNSIEKSEGKWYFTPEIIKLYEDSAIIGLNYIDENGCSETKNSIVYVDEIYNPPFDIELNNIDSKFCAIDEEILFNGNDFSIDTLIGHGIRYNESDNEYNFNPRKAIDSTIAEYKIPFNINLELRNNSYWYDTTYNVEVYPFPLTDDYSAENACFGEATVFSGTPSFPNTTDNLTWEWDFGNLEKISYTGPINNTTLIPDLLGNTTGTYTNPEQTYALAGKYNAILKLTSEDGCTAIDTFHIVVGSYPKVSFNASGFIYNSVTHFSNLTIDAAFDTIVDYTWQFGNSAPVSYPTPTSNELDYLFTSHGVHNVTLTATSENGCATTDSIKVPVFDTVMVSSSNTYEALFNITEDDWIPSQRYIEDENLPSGWRHQDVAEPFNSEPNTSGMIWQTGDPADKITDENSWVESPCFDIRNLDFPLLSMDIYQSVEEGRDGAALQYTINDGETWNLLGDEGVGVNWYDTRGIVSNPGNQNVGWSLDAQEWKTARYSLDDLKQEVADSAASYVRFRVAYSSDAGNAPGIETQGFAFDNFTLTSRNRVVMMEQFVNSTQDKTLQQDEEAWLNYFLEGKDEEVVDMRYHNFISHYYDPLFYVNPPDISSRSMEYGATMAQLTMVDGVYRCLANSEVEASLYYKERTLTDISFDINVNHAVSGDKLSITADITKLKDDLLNTVGSEKCVVRMAIVQHGYEYEGETFNNVVIELLPNGEGNVVASIPADFAKDESMTVKGSWTPNVTTKGNEFRLVVYVQGIWGVDEIHQVWFQDSIDVPQVTVAAPTESFKSKSGNSFTIYPSPVKEKLNISWYETLESPVQWKLVSMSGTVVKQGITPAGKMREEINTYQLNKGIYLLVTEDLSTLEVDQRKILIIK